MRKNSFNYNGQTDQSVVKPFQNSKLHSIQMTPIKKNPHELITTATKNVYVSQKSVQSTKSESRVNKLPINLFHNSAEYRKILITNGRQIDRRYILDGVIENFQYINHDIYSKEEQKCWQNRFLLEQKRRNRQHSSIQRNQYYNKCQYRCCDKYCDICNKNSNNINRTYQSSKPNECKTDQIIKNYNKIRKIKNIIDNTSKLIDKAIKFHPKQNKPLKNNKKKNQIQPSSSQQLLQSKRSKSVNSLIMKSVNKFEKSLKQKKIEQILQKKLKNQKKQFFKYMDKNIRQFNKINNYSLSNEKIKQPSALQQRKQYWQSVKHHVKTQLDRYKSEPKPFKQSSKNKTCHLKNEISYEQRQFLKKKYQQVAKSIIAEKKKIKQSNKNKIKQALMELDKKRHQILKNNIFVPFKPTKQEIDNAFTKNDKI